MSRGLFWFRSDLRIKDNPALNAAAACCDQLALIYIYPPDESIPWSIGSASKWWLHHSLCALQKDLALRGCELQLISGEADEILLNLCKQHRISQVFWNRVYEPANIASDKDIKQLLKQNDINVKSFNSSLLYEPWDISKDDGTPYRVFTPYWKMIQKRGLEFNLEKNIKTFPKTLKLNSKIISKDISNFNLLPKFNWDAQFHQYWHPGEQGAQKQFKTFLKFGIHSYKEGRDLPAENFTSKISPYLHFGEISSRQITTSIQKHAQKFSHDKKLTIQVEAYIREVAWREFAYHLLFHFPHTVDKPLNHKYSRFPWSKRYSKQLTAWQQGQTGIPLVDAGMRELWHTGWMHNRVRMVVGSLLTKNLLIPWQTGSQWFWDTLVDADLANNTLGWQWIAGCGADASPYYRIFNPVLQSKKFDHDGKYVRRWVPELSELPAKYIHAPWETPTEELKRYGLILGKHYPKPIVDLKVSREQTLSAYNKIK